MSPQTEEHVPIAELLRRVQTLELIGRRNAAGLRPGDYQTAVRGRGLLFEEPRKYVPGDEARRIDWNITARLGGDPHVRVHLEERQRDVMVLLDVSPSMHFGSRRHTKLEIAVELAATLAVAATDAGDRLGHVLFADRALAETRPRAGRAQLFRMLQQMLENTAPWRREVGVSDPRAAIHAVEKNRGRFAIFLISDFIDHDVPDDLRYLRARHDVTLLHVYDPLEFAAHPQTRHAPRLAGRASEGASDASPLRLGGGESLEQMQAFLRRRCGELRMDFASFSTLYPARFDLRAFFHRRR